MLCHRSGKKKRGVSVCAEVLLAHLQESVQTNLELTEVHKANSVSSRGQRGAEGDAFFQDVSHLREFSLQSRNGEKTGLEAGTQKL